VQPFLGLGRIRLRRLVSENRHGRTQAGISPVADGRRRSGPGTADGGWRSGDHPWHWREQRPGRKHDGNRRRLERRRARSMPLEVMAARSAVAPEPAGTTSSGGRTGTGRNHRHVDGPGRPERLEIAGSSGGAGGLDGGIDGCQRPARMDIVLQPLAKAFCAAGQDFCLRDGFYTIDLNDCEAKLPARFSRTRCSAGHRHNRCNPTRCLHRRYEKAATTATPPESMLACQGLWLGTQRKASPVAGHCLWCIRLQGNENGSAACYLARCRELSGGAGVCVALPRGKQAIHAVRAAGRPGLHRGSGRQARRLCRSCASRRMPLLCGRGKSPCLQVLLEGGRPLLL